MPDAKSEIEALLKDPAFLKDYRAKTHGKHSDAPGRDAHARHLAARERMRLLYERKSKEDRTIEVETQASALATQRKHTERKKLLNSEAYRDKKHPDHENAVARVAGMYRQDNAT